MLRELANNEIQHFNYNRRQRHANQKTLGFVPEPGAKFLIGKIVVMLNSKSVVVEAQSEQLANQHEHHDIKKNRESVILEASMHGEIAQRAVPSCCQQRDEQEQAEDKVGDTEPSPNAVVPPRFG